MLYFRALTTGHRAAAGGERGATRRASTLRRGRGLAGAARANWRRATRRRQRGSGQPTRQRIQRALEVLRADGPHGCPTCRGSPQPTPLPARRLRAAADRARRSSIGASTRGSCEMMAAGLAGGGACAPWPRRPRRRTCRACGPSAIGSSGSTSRATAALEAAVAAGQRATRNLAKRQLTWSARPIRTLPAKP